MSSSFYVVVASDASIDQYPENTPSSFKMQLPSQLHLSEDWEVAMTHIIYPHTWENILSNQVSYLLRYNGEKEWTLPIYLPRDTQNSRGFDQWYGDRIRKCLSRHLYQEWKEDQTSWRQTMFLHSRKSQKLL